MYSLPVHGRYNRALDVAKKSDANVILRLRHLIPWEFFNAQLMGRFAYLG